MKRTPKSFYLYRRLKALGKEAHHQGLESHAGYWAPFILIGIQSPQSLKHFSVACSPFPVPFKAKYNVLTDMSVAITGE
jgi:hypothetical protein